MSPRSENILVSPKLFFFCHFQDKIDTIHEQVIRGDIRHVRNLLDKKGWANARDHYGHSPLHKSIMANQEEIMRFILETYPDHVEDRDNVSFLLIYRSHAINSLSWLQAALK